MKHLLLLTLAPPPWTPTEHCTVWHQNAWRRHSPTTAALPESQAPAELAAAGSSQHDPDNQQYHNLKPDFTDWGGLGTARCVQHTCLHTCIHQSTVHHAYMHHAMWSLQVTQVASCRLGPQAEVRQLGGLPGTGWLCVVTNCRCW